MLSAEGSRHCALIESVGVSGGGIADQVSVGVVLGRIIGFEKWEKK